MAEPATEERKRSSILLIAALAAVVVVGIFVAGFLVGGTSTSPSATPTPTTTTLPCTSTSNRCSGFTSRSSATVVAGSRFSFTVTTTGAPVPKIKKLGRLPMGVRFRNNHNGTATLVGTPTTTKTRAAAGTYPLTFVARWGEGDTKQVVTQAFTLTVLAGSP
jgi:hypothetical protein